MSRQSGHETQNLDTTKKVTLLDFSATWCAPCRAMAPIVDQLAREYSDMACIEKIDIDEQGDLARQMRIQSVPTLIFLKNGQETKRLIGLQDKEILKTNLEAALD